MSMLNRKRSILSKIEATYGTDATPTGAANAILIGGDPSITPLDAKTADRKLIRPFYGNADKIPSQYSVKLAFPVELAGSGTAGTPPPIGILLRGCGYAETILATPVTGTAVSGATNTITLAVGASAVDNAYRGMRLDITAGVGSGQGQTIIAYSGSTKVATLADIWTTPPTSASTYNIPAQVAYAPISSAFESLTHYYNVDGVLHKALGARGNVAFDFVEDTFPMAKFSFIGVFASPADSASPTVVLSPWQTPVPVNKANTVALTLQAFAAAMSSFNVDTANQVEFRSLPGASDQVMIVDRQPSGQALMEAVSIATKDWWTNIKNGTTGALQFEHGLTIGNKLRVCCPKVQLISPTYQDQQGVAMLQSNLIVMPPSGNDEILLSFL